MLEIAMSWIVGQSVDWLGFLLSAALKGAMLLAIAALAALLLRRASAATRHQLWLVAIVCALAVPALSLLVPRLSISVPGLERWSAGEVWSGDRASIARWIETPSEIAPLPPLPPVPPMPVMDGALELPPLPGAAPVLAGRIEGIVISGVPGVSESAAIELPSTPLPAGIPGSTADMLSRVPWALLVLSTWAIGAWFVLAALVLGVLRVRWLSWRLPPFGGRCATLTRAVADDIGLGQIEVLRGPAAAMPMTWGVFRPTIVLPSSAAEWPIERLDAVIRHELAHVRRRDTLTQLIADIGCAVYWFNPLAWIAAHRLRVEREHACDDEVLASGSRASDYAEQLLLLTRSLRIARATSLTAIAMARPAQLRGRLHALLDDDRSRARLSRTDAARGWALGAVLALPLAMLGFAPAPAAFAEAPDAIRVYAAGPDEVAVFPSGVTIGIDRIETTARIVARDVVAPRIDSRWLTAPAAVIAAPTPPLPGAAHAQGCWDATDRKGGLSIRHNDDVREISWKSERCRAAVRIEGEVEFTEDFRSIARLSRGGEARFEEDDGRTERILEIRPDGNGLGYEYRVNGDERPFDAQARAWFDGILLQLFRTGFAAEERVAWMLRTRGVDAVIQEIGQLRSSYPRRIYYQATLEHPELSTSQVAMLIRRAGTEITSDYELAELLMATSDDRPFSAEIRDAFLEASTSLDSDYEHRRVLALVLSRGDLSAANVATMLESAGAIGSDYERAELLVALAQRYIDAPELRTAYLRAAAGIGSDYEKRRVLDAVLGLGALSAVDVATVLTVASSVGSDYERAELLVGISDNDMSALELQHAYVAAVNGIRSDYEHRRALSALLAKQQLDPVVVAQALGSIRDIKSDYEKAELLLEIANKHSLEGEVRAEFLRALDTIRSSHEHGRVSSALLRAERR